MTEILTVAGLEKDFATTKGGTVSIINNITFTIREGEKVAIIGPSGSGKSTLLSIIGLLDTQTRGEISILGQVLAKLSEDDQARFRNKNIGFIFQSFELIGPFTVRENIVAPLEIGGSVPVLSEVDSLIESVGLTHREAALPHTLSGGEKQRVAIARALVHKPALLLADEPTGSLDRATGEKVLDLLLTAVADRGTTLVIITHDESIASRMDRVFEIRDQSLHERL